MSRIVWAVALLASLAATCVAVTAHPLGNFTINHLVKVVATRSELHIRYIVDRAEIPTFQLMRASSRDATWTPSLLRRWADAQAPLVNDQAQLRPGSAGLPTLYWRGDFAIAIAPGAHHVSIKHRVYDAARVGWKDIVIAPQTEPTHELQSYPPAMTGSPRAVRSAAFELSRDALVSQVIENADADGQAPSGASIARSNALSGMFAAHNRAPLFLIFTVLVAFGLGALHAIEPGHGKAIGIAVVHAARSGRLDQIATRGLLIATLTALAIAGYALTPKHTHAQPLGTS